MHLQELHKTASFFPSTSLMPCLFLGHGSPMNAIEENEFVIGFRIVAMKLIPADGKKNKKLDFRSIFIKNGQI